MTAPRIEVITVRSKGQPQYDLLLFPEARRNLFTRVLESALREKWAKFLSEISLDEPRHPKEGDPPPDPRPVSATGRVRATSSASSIRKNFYKGRASERSRRSPRPELCRAEIGEDRRESWEAGRARRAISRRRSRRPILYLSMSAMIYHYLANQ